MTFLGDVDVHDADHDSLSRLIAQASDPLGLKNQFLQRLSQGSLTRDENPQSHFCAFFAPFDPVAKQVFIGHHIKADRWLFNGGHLDQGETPLEAMKREMKEEWGEEIGPYMLLPEHLLTITDIDSSVVSCRKHYDLWYFVQIDKNQFKPDEKKLAKEFHQWGWKTEAQAKALCRDQDVGEVLKMINGFINSVRCKKLPQ